MPGRGVRVGLGVGPGRGVRVAVGGIAVGGAGVSVGTAVAVSSGVAVTLGVRSGVAVWTETLGDAVVAGEPSAVGSRVAVRVADAVPLPPPPPPKPPATTAPIANANTMMPSAAPPNSSSRFRVQSAPSPAAVPRGPPAKPAPPAPAVPSEIAPRSGREPTVGVVPPQRTARSRHISPLKPNGAGIVENDPTMAKGFTRARRAEPHCSQDWRCACTSRRASSV